ncbi:MAG: holin, partial [Acidimicrobiia bacterium]|nr:holin [Acidimicrobiia bacterium]
MFTSTFWKDAAERAVKTAAQAALLALGGDMIDVFAGLALWQTIGGAAAGGALLSILTSVATAASTGDDESASFVASPE